MKDSLNLDELAEVVAWEKNLAWLSLLVTGMAFIGSFMLPIAIAIVIGTVGGNNSSFGTIAIAASFLGYLSLPVITSISNYLAYRRAVERVAESTPFQLPNRSLRIVFATIGEYAVFAILLVGLLFVGVPFLAALGILLVWENRHRLLFHFLVNRPIKKGKLEAAYRRLNWLKKLYPRNPMPATMQANLLLTSGKVKAGELAYREALARAQLTANPLLISVALNDLGYFFTLLGRFEESLPFLEMSIRISPALGAPYDSLALYYLEQGICPERAIELSERAIEYTKNMPASRSIQQATLARALAMMGITDEAETKLAEAIKHGQKTKHAALLPELYRLAGHTKLLLGQTDAARLFFQRAILNGENNLFGRVAQRDLNRLEKVAAAG